MNEYNSAMINPCVETLLCQDDKNDETKWNRFFSSNFSFVGHDNF